MARRALVVWIDAEAKHCGGCRFKTIEPLGSGYDAVLVPVCAIFGWLTEDRHHGAERSASCLRAETFAGG